MGHSNVIAFIDICWIANPVRTSAIWCFPVIIIFFFNIQLVPYKIIVICQQHEFIICTARGWSRESWYTNQFGACVINLLFVTNDYLLRYLWALHTMAMLSRREMHSKGGETNLHMCTSIRPARLQWYNKHLKKYSVKRTHVVSSFLVAVRLFTNW